MKRSKIILAVCLTSVAMIVNFILAIFFHGESGANIFTTVSGWVSGIATIVLGVIAIKINAKYKEENDTFLQKQDEMFWKNEKKSIVELYREQVIKCYNNFIALNFTDILNQLIANENKIEAPVFNLSILSKIQTEKHKMFFTLSICKYYFNYKKELFDSYSKYLTLLSEMVNNYDDMIYNKKFEMGEKLQDTYIEVINYFNIHISEINVFLSTHLYSKSKEELSTMLNEMRSKQLDWWENTNCENEDNIHKNPNTNGDK